MQPVIHLLILQNIRDSSLKPQPSLVTSTWASIHRNTHVCAPCEVAPPWRYCWRGVAGAGAAGLPPARGARARMVVSATAGGPWPLTRPTAWSSCGVRGKRLALPTPPGGCVRMPVHQRDVVAEFGRSLEGLRHAVCYPQERWKSGFLGVHTPLAACKGLWLPQGSMQKPDSSHGVQATLRLCHWPGKHHKPAWQTP